MLAEVRLTGLSFHHTRKSEGLGRPLDNSPGSEGNDLLVKAAPLPVRDPIQIQTHNSPLRIRKGFIHELAAFDGPGAR